MSALLSSPDLFGLLSYVVNALWQLPLVYAAALLAARLLRRASPRAEHRVWVVALFAQLLLPACAMRVSALGALLPGMASGRAGDGHVRVLLGAGAPAPGMLHLPAGLAAALAAACAVGVFLAAGRIAWGLGRARRIARAATRVTLGGEEALLWSRLCRRMGVTQRAPEIAVSSRDIGPMALGLGRGLLLVPAGFFEHVTAADLEAVFAHELAHAARRDFAKNLVYSIAALPLAWHPLLPLTRARVAESREVVCDAMAAESVAGRRQYARSLLRLASMLSLTPPADGLAALGILGFPTHNRTLERRIMSLTCKSVPLGTLGRCATAAACAALALATAASALTWHTAIASAAPAAANSAPAPSSLNVKPELIAKNKISGENPEYPPEAKAKKIQGTVVLNALIGKDGTIEHLDVLKSPDKLLSKSSLDAVRTWRYRPYLLNGEPVEVETTIHVIYSLGG